LTVGDKRATCFVETTATTIMALHHTHSSENELRAKMQDRFPDLKEEESRFVKEQRGNDVDLEHQDAWSGAGEPNVWSTSEALDS
jgi:hypothetical protein